MEEEPIDIEEVHRVLHYLLRTTKDQPTLSAKGAKNRIDTLLTMRRHVLESFPWEIALECSDMILTRADRECVKLIRLRGFKWKE